MDSTSPKEVVNLGSHLVLRQLCTCLTQLMRKSLPSIRMSNCNTDALQFIGCLAGAQVAYCGRILNRNTALEPQWMVGQNIFRFFFFE